MVQQDEDTSVEAVFDRYADRTAIRQRDGEVVTDTSFRELRDRARALAGCSASPWPRVTGSRCSVRRAPTS
jgi:fatty acid CoA ligase FadD9